jgi:hypothetical protein
MSDLGLNVLSFVMLQTVVANRHDAQATHSDAMRAFRPHRSANASTRTTRDFHVNIYALSGGRALKISVLIRPSTIGLFNPGGF